ncbi:MAG: glycoside hydrolase family 13 protein [Acidimicrobiales bacterium]|nr:glycoside hydrolase family 13 protein [Acidimicrobiales bacterium]MCB9395130.1 glycoside hydrolase family 13 protein [Acidimicrobiaceae bacterium]
MGDQAWWRSAVIYQVYIRSFADGDGDGLGDIAGLHAELDHLVSLGVDAIWINPWYPSPFADAGYDVSDFRAIEPRFGTLDDAERLIAAAHERGLRVLLDIVPNHTSDQHVWFQAALAAGPGSPERERYIFRDGRGPDGELPPNDWRSAFHGPAWTRITEADGTPGPWYLHLFAPEQPDVNWHHPDVHADFLETLRFWFDRGADGFRIDVAHSLVKEDGLPDIAERDWAKLPFRLEPAPGVHQTDHPHWDRDEVHDIYREWRRTADAYDPPRVFVAEAWVPDPSRAARYLRPDELHTAFNFDFLRSRWNAADLRGVVDDTMREHRSVGATPTWVLSNHDVARHVSRFARPQQTGVRGHHLNDLAADHDLAVGTRRARAAAMLMFALPGSCYVYQGEELGLPEVEDLPDASLQDPTWFRSNGTDRGRDGCRVPIPWTADPSTNFGFSHTVAPAAPAAPWLPQPSWFAAYAADVQRGVAGSMLELYRSCLARRRADPALGDGELAWMPSPAGSLVFVREPGFGCVVNVDAEPLPLPAGWTPVLGSGDLVDGLVPPDTTVWCHR